MSGRERTLAKIAGAIIALGALYFGGQAVVGVLFSDLEDQLAELKTDFESKTKQKRAAAHFLNRYRQLGEMIPKDEGGAQAVTKSDEERTREYVHRRINDVLSSSKFDTKKITPPPPAKRGSRGKKKKLKLLTYSVEGHGDLKTVVQFLLDLYRMDDLLYVSSVDIKPGRREFSSGVDATIKIQTMVVPQHKKLVRLASRSGSDPEPTDAQAPEKLGRLGAPDMAGYDVLKNWRPFDPVRPDKPAPVAKSSSGPGGGEPDPPDTGDPDRDNKIVRAFMNDSVLVVKKSVRSRGRRGSRGGAEDERSWFDLGEDFDGGTLELVHRLGLVVSKTEEEEEAEEQSQPSKLWAYQYGEAFSQSRLLDELIKEFGEFRQLLWAWQERPQPEQVGPPAPDNGTKLHAQGNKEAAQESSNELLKSSN